MVAGRRKLSEEKLEREGEVETKRARERKKKKRNARKISLRGSEISPKRRNDSGGKRHFNDRFLLLFFKFHTVISPFYEAR